MFAKRIRKMTRWREVHDEMQGDFVLDGAVRLAAVPNAPFKRPVNLPAFPNLGNQLKFAAGRATVGPILLGAARPADPPLALPSTGRWIVNMTALAVAEINVSN
jgi:phosphotransacetylase